MTGDDVKAIMEQRRAAGTLPGARGTGTKAAGALAALPETALPRRLPITCFYLGPPAGGGCASIVRACRFYGGTTTAQTRCDSAARHCPSCGTKDAEGV